jgi:putative ABC transport system permease protein
MMATLWQDVRYALRMLGKSPAFTLVAIVTLAIGIGANSSIFSVVHAVMLRPLPFDRPQELYMIWGTTKNIEKEAASYPDFVDWRDQAQKFENIAGFFNQNANLSTNDQADRASAYRISANLFRTMHVQPVIGRDFTSEDDKAGAAKVVILSYELWQKRFGGNRDIVGSPISINGLPYDVIGVAPKGFRILGSADLWMPMAIPDNQKPGRRNDFIGVIGRVKPGVTREAALTEMNLIAKRLEQQYPDSNTGWTLKLVPLHEELVGNVKEVLVTLWAAVGLVMLIVCVNVASLLLTRSAARKKELAIRAALGASPGRLVRQLLTEAMILGLIGGGLGLLLANWGTRLLIAYGSTTVPRLQLASLDSTVLLFTLAVSLIAGLLFGMAPALEFVRPRLATALNEGGRVATQSVGSRRLRRTLVIAEVSVSLMLLIGAGLMIRTLESLQGVDAGFRPEKVLAFRVFLPPAQYKDEQIITFVNQMIERASGLPGVKSVGAVNGLYIREGAPILTFSVEGRADAGAGNEPDAHLGLMTPGFYSAMGIKLVRGRLIEPQDQANTPLVAVVNETFVKRNFPNEDPIGKRVTMDGDENGKPTNWRTIVGIVKDVKQDGLDQAVYPEMQVPMAQGPRNAMTFVVRTDGDPKALTGTIREQIRSLDPNLPIYAVQTMDEILAESVATRRFSMYLFAAFALIALGLAAIGIYGVMAQSVTQRVQEIGVRMALGARPKDILTMILSQGTWLVLVGVIAGLTGAMFVSRFLRALLFGVQPIDPITYAAVTIVLVVVALLASYLPARRAAKVDPMVALRYE